MKKFWGKYKVALITVIAVTAFVVLSLLVEVSTKKGSVTVDLDAIYNNEYSVVVIGLTYCGHCHNFNPIINEISEEYNLPLYWYDIDDLDEENSELLYNTFSENGYEGSSPYIAVLNYDEVITYHVGEMDKETTLEFLNEANVIK